MKPILLTLTAMLLASLAAHAQQTPSPATTVRDRLWLFTVHAGANNVEHQSKHHICDFAPGGSRMTPAEGAFWLGVPNVLFIRAKDIPPLPSAEPGRSRTSFEQYAMSFAPLDRVVWSVVGAGGHGGMNELPPVLDLAKKSPNITRIYLDDFIVKAKVQPDGHKLGQPALRVEELKQARGQMKAAGRPLEMWATLYTHEINPARKLAEPVFQACEPPLVGVHEALRRARVLDLEERGTERPGKEPRALAIEPSSTPWPVRVGRGRVDKAIPCYQ